MSGYGDGDFTGALARYWESQLGGEDRDSEREERSLWERHGREATVLILDMTGFSRITAERGIVHFLALVALMQQVAPPVIEEHGGEVVKFEADNCFALFPDPGSAVRPARALHVAFARVLPAGDDGPEVGICCGIDHGPLLVVGSDVFGHPVNRACKLGEDIALAGQVLVTAEAMETIGEDGGFRAEAITVEGSGIRIDAFSIEFEG